jgi:hypothetical protein
LVQLLSARRQATPETGRKRNHSKEDAILLKCGGLAGLLSGKPQGAKENRERTSLLGVFSG